MTSKSFSHATTLGFFAFLAVALGLSAHPPQARAATPAESFVATSVEQAYAVLNDRSLDAARRLEQFRDIMLSITDMRRVALFTLGPYANGASESDTMNFVAAFTDFVTAVYQHGLETYAGRTLRVTGSAPRSANDVVVSADILDPSGHPSLKIAFRVRKDGGGKYVLTDLQVEGAWLALSQRADFISYLQQHHGDIALLSRELTRRAEQVRAKSHDTGAQS